MSSSITKAQQRRQRKNKKAFELYESSFKREQNKRQRLLRHIKAHEADTVAEAALHKVAGILKGVFSRCMKIRSRKNNA